MALKDVKQNFIEIQNQYFELLDDVKDFDEAFKEGRFTQEQYEEALAQVEKLKSHYEYWSYFMFLLNKPNNKKKQAKYEKQEEIIVKALRPYEASHVLKENENVLTQFRKLLEDNK